MRARKRTGAPVVYAYRAVQLSERTRREIMLWAAAIAAALRPTSERSNQAWRPEPWRTR